MYDRRTNPESSCEKKVLSAASAYKYTKDNKLFLPTLIKAAETDKI